MGQIWVVTGPPGVGKSTLVSKVILRLKSAGIIVGGCTTVEKRVRGTRVGFQIKDLASGTVGELSSVSGKLGPRVGKYRVDLVDLSRVGAAGLAHAAAHSEVIIIDELGPMELVSPEFRRRAKECIDSGKPLIAVVHERLDDDLIVEVKEKARQDLTLTLENRDELVSELADAVVAAVGPPKAS
jgi:nucleoside-triphosphatase